MKLYCARDKRTGKLVCDITNPGRKFWQRKGNCEAAINCYNKDRFHRHDYDLELVEFYLVEVGRPFASQGIEEFCPKCGAEVGYTDAMSWEHPNYCHNCGQGLDWGDERK